MAWTVATNEKTVFGNFRAHIISFTADSAECNLTTGFSRVVAFSVGQQSFSTAALKFYANKNSSGTASLGTIGISGAVSGDVGFITVFGV